MIETNKVYLGNTLAILKTWPDNFIDCCVTSPPYWGLRSYGTPPQIWDGDDSCEHVWTKAKKHPKHDNRTPEEKLQNGSRVGSNIATAKHAPVDQGQSCEKCNAWKGELGLEPDFRDYIRHLIQIFREIYRCLKPTGTVWVNLGDSYNQNSSSSKKGRGGLGDDFNGNFNRMQSVVKPKSLMQIPHRFSIAMTDELGFILRNDLIWWKRSAMPSSATDRFTVDFENIFFFTKREKYYFEQQFERCKGTIGPRKETNPTHDANVSVPYDRAGNPHGEMRNRRTVLDINTEGTDEEHYAAYPTRLVELPITAGCPVDGIVFDPFMGTGTTAVVALRLGRRYLGTELQESYYEILSQRIGLEEQKGRLF